MIRRSTRLVAVMAGTGLALGSLAATSASASSDAGGWAVDTSNCPDPDAANAPIEGEIFIGSAMPRTGGAAAAAFEPAAQGLETFVAYANDNDLLPGVTINLVVGDDQYNPGLTPGVVEGLLDDGAQMITALIGTDNALAVRDTLNEECVPMLNLLTGAPIWGTEIADYPWTTGLLMSYEHEFHGYAESIAEQFPGETVATYHLANEFGIVSVEAFRAAAADAGIEIVASETVEFGDESLPAAQVAAIAEAQPGVIVAVPIGAQCVYFLAALAEAKAANPGWDPAVYLTNTCGSSSLIMGIAGPAADGIYTSAAMGIKDVANPAVQEADPLVAAYVQEMTDRGQAENITTGAAGWMAGEVTLAVLQAAQASPDGLTQASIINAARSLNFRPTLLRDGMNFIMNGEEDGFYSEDVQVLQFHADTMIFSEVGDVYSYETSPDLVPADG